MAEETKRLAECQGELQSQKRAAVDLEKRLARQNMDSECFHPQLDFYYNFFFVSFYVFFAVQHAHCVASIHFDIANSEGEYDTWKISKYHVIIIKLFYSTIFNV